MSSNSILVGRLTAAPELRFAKSGTPWATFSIAVTRGRDDDKETSFFDCKCFGALAENISELPKGTRVIADGYLVQEKWETKEKQKRSKVVLMVNDAGGGPVAVPWGGTQAFLSTNPLAAAVPRAQGPPLVIDMATSISSFGKVRMRADRGQDIPPDWLIEANGQITQDPHTL